MFCRFRKGGDRRGVPSESMADIAFLLIVFFMVTAVFSAAKGLDFELPADEAADQPIDPVPAITLCVSDRGYIVMDGRSVSRSEILPYVAGKLERWPQKPVVLQASEGAPYRAFVAVYDELSRWNAPAEAGGLGHPTALNLVVPTRSELIEYERLFGEDPFERAC